MTGDSIHKILLLLVLAILIGTGIFLWGAPQSSGPVFPHDTMIIQRADGKQLPFNIEIASTPAQTQYGLMFRRSMPEDAGMLFLFAPEQAVSFWMKNTYIPLDMLFVHGDGTIGKIVTHAQPFDLATINSDEPIRGVVEINGGMADRLGLKSGDKVLFKGFSGQ